MAAVTDGVEETIKELKKIPGFSSYLIINNDGIVIKYENMSLKHAIHYASVVLALAAKATKYVKELFEVPDVRGRDLFACLCGVWGLVGLGWAGLGWAASRRWSRGRPRAPPCCHVAGVLPPTTARTAHLLGPALGGARTTCIFSHHPSRPVPPSARPLFHVD